MRTPSMLPTETVLLAIDAIRANKFRSILTVLGIVVGVAVVVVVASILTGLRTTITSMVEEYGTNNIYAFHLSTGIQVGGRDRSEYQRKPLSKEDGQAILQQAPAVREIANVVFLWRLDHTLQYREHKYRQGSLVGVSADYPQITNSIVREGRFITEADDTHKRDVIVIGPNVADALFPNYKQIVGSARSRSLGCWRSARTRFLGRTTKTIRCSSHLKQDASSHRAPTTSCCRFSLIAA